jgi:alkylation response protein AidB-like acyl-CoA dehydrogenase
LGIEAVLVDPSAPGFSAGLLPMIGLRGARISWLRFENVRIPADHLLGARLRPSRRGLQGALYGLYRFRPGIAALALGCAEATRDYLGMHRSRLAKGDQSEVDGVADRIAAARRLLHRVAVDLDHDHGDPHRISEVKAQAAQVAEDMTMLAARLLGPASLLEHPWLEKTCRDVRAFDIMEGPANLHRLAVFQGLRKATYLPGGGNVARH